MIDRTVLVLFSCSLFFVCLFVLQDDRRSLQTSGQVLSLPPRSSASNNVSNSNSNNKNNNNNDEEDFWDCLTNMKRSLFLQCPSFSFFSFFNTFLLLSVFLRSGDTWGRMDGKKREEELRRINDVKKNFNEIGRGLLAMFLVFLLLLCLLLGELVPESFLFVVSVD